LNHVTEALAPTDLNNCDIEPIRTPGSVQSYGALLVIEPKSFLIQRAAGATMALLGHVPADLLGRDFTLLIGADNIARLQRFIGANDIVRPMHLLRFCAVVEGCMLDMSVHRVGVHLVFEFEQADSADLSAINPLAMVQAMLAGVDDATQLADFCQSATDQVRRVSGYDRVMVYRFLPDDSGWVFAESKDEGVEPYLGLRYPASDIPKQARALYLANWLRIIADVDDVRSPIVSSEDVSTLTPLDMSHATLRTASPIHLEYLRNMGVAATMTISIIKGDRLWGLIACHHRSPKCLPRDVRAACELFGNMFAFQLEARERAESLEYRHRSSSIHSALVSRMAQQDNLGEGLVGERPSLLDYIDAAGVVVIVDGHYEAMGQTPRESQVRALVSWLDENKPEGFYATDSLSRDYDLGRDFAIDGSGVIAISASRQPSDYILWFRPEVIETVRWAGDPNKPVEVGPFGDRLTPRKSFEAWSKSVRLQAKPWTQNEIDAAAEMRTSLLQVVLRRIDQIARERGIAQERHEIMLAELNHRVKNTLSTIQALARYTSKSASTLEDYVLNFERRILSMAASHALLSDTSWEKISLSAIIKAQLAPYLQKGNIEIDGPDVQILVIAATPLGIVLHELATNAAKHGALSTNGRVVIGWTIVGDDYSPTLQLTWRESGGPAVQKPTRVGFGTFALEKILPFQCGGKTDIRYEPGGVECDMELSAETFRATVSTSGDQIAPLTDMATTKILIVEDEAFIAFTLQQAVRDMGFVPVGPVSRVHAATVIARSENLAGAILDINVAGEFIWPVAQILQDRDIPFLFLTGYSAVTLTNLAFSDVLILSKPFTQEDVTHGLQSLLEQHSMAEGDHSRDTHAPRAENVATAA
jgi:two-component system, chemotaxis family, sensor kinase Cph1